jgi:hypothetical protein
MYAAPTFREGLKLPTQNSEEPQKLTFFNKQNHDA